MEESYREQHEDGELQRGLSQRVKGRTHKFSKYFHLVTLDPLCTSIKCNYSKINFQTHHFYLTPMLLKSLEATWSLIYMYHVVRGVISLLLSGMSATNPQVLAWHYFTTYSEGHAARKQETLCIKTGNHTFCNCALFLTLLPYCSTQFPFLWCFLTVYVSWCLHVSGKPIKS